ncbi:unnamed protein product [Heligmosomoides polygyrus]|uniref:Uncharacterized protein n=1 Tax=Heligmosomoides polygyrus TaxID=6339 RepID=A0A183GWZ6_HELPZ|nr:unnamed protein product [Heligmosomoides polygyrus]
MGLGDVRFFTHRRNGVSDLEWTTGTTLLFCANMAQVDVAVREDYTRLRVAVRPCCSSLARSAKLGSQVLLKAAQELADHSGLRIHNSPCPAATAVRNESFGWMGASSRSDFSQPSCPLATYPLRPQLNLEALRVAVRPCCSSLARSAKLGSQVLLKAAQELADHSGLRIHNSPCPAATAVRNESFGWMGASSRSDFSQPSCPLATYPLRPQLNLEALRCVPALSLVCGRPRVLSMGLFRIEMKPAAKQ